MALGRKIMITGPPGCGKTTLVTKLIGQIDRSMTGFITTETRREGRRTGFVIKTLTGEQGILAHSDLPTRNRVGKYGVNLEVIERIAVPSMVADDPNQMVIIDEIGKMECFSPLFRQTLLSILDSERDILATISLKGSSFIENVKNRPDVDLVHLSVNNRDQLIEIASRFQVRVEDG